MICPYCEYKHGYEWDDNKNPKSGYVDVKGKHGEFWKFPLPMQRDSQEYHSTHETINIYACPVCKKMFLLDD